MERTSSLTVKENELIRGNVERREEGKGARKEKEGRPPTQRSPKLAPTAQELLSQFEMIFSAVESRLRRWR